MSFTDGKPRVATEQDCRLRWSSGKPGERFRCYLCGHRFKVGDVWRFVFDNDSHGKGQGNFLVCETCDGPDVRERWWAMCAELRASKDRCWWSRA